jgi:tripartite-type tricarboxylate transporter receptor subunit TctC
MKRMFAAASAALSVFAAAPAVAEQAWPARPLELIVPYGPGGSTDRLSRAIAERLGGALGQPVVVEDRPGGNTITGPDRVSTLPEVPTIAESGYPGYDASIWFGTVVPKGTPQPVVQRLNAELVRILCSDEMRQKFDPLALERMASTPEEMSAFVAKESQKWGKVNRDFNIRVEQ